MAVLQASKTDSRVLSSPPFRNVPPAVSTVLELLMKTVPPAMSGSVTAESTVIVIVPAAADSAAFEKLRRCGCSSSMKAGMSEAARAQAS